MQNGNTELTSVATDSTEQIDGVLVGQMGDELGDQEVIHVGTSMGDSNEEQSALTGETGEVQVPSTEEEKAVRPGVEHRILIIHDKDQDGYCAANIIRDYKKQPTVAVGMVPFGHGRDLRSIVIDTDKWDELFVVDLVCPLTWIMDLIAQGFKVTIIDHHDSTLNALQGVQDASLCIKVGSTKAACGLAWEHLYGDSEMPWVVKMINDWDIWNHEDPQVIPFHYGMECLDMNDTKIWKQLLKGDPQSCNQIMQMGQLVGSYWVNEMNTITSTFSYVLEKSGLKLLCCNGWFGSSYDFAATANLDMHDGIMWFRYDPTFATKPWRLSLRTTKEGVNLLPLVEQYNGGGHVQSCGAYVTNEEMKEWFPTYVE